MCGVVVCLVVKKVIKKVKSMQMFKKPVNTAEMGDRLGICVTQFDAKKVERGQVNHTLYKSKWRNKQQATPGFEMYFCYRIPAPLVQGANHVLNPAYR